MDIVKGLGILLMVFRHTEAPYSEFVLLFHMAIFFIASGYLFDRYKAADINALKIYFIKKIKTLWIPYFGFMTLFILFHNLFLKASIITADPSYLEEYTGRYAVLYERYNIADVVREIIKAAIFHGKEQIGGALWFFFTLFLLSIGYAVVSFVLNKFCVSNNRYMIIQCIISIVFLLAGYYMHIHNISLFGLNRFFSYYCLIFIGNIMKGKLDVLYKKLDPVILFVLSFAVLIIIRPYGYIDLAGNNIENPIYFIAASVTGWFMIYSLAVILEKINFIGNKMLYYLSIHSVPIIGLHFLAFKLINCLAVCVSGQQSYMIAAFPVLMHGMWWILYLITGIVIPLTLQRTYLYIKGLKLRNLD